MIRAILRRIFEFFVRVRTLAVLTATIFAVAAVVASSTPIFDPDVWWIAAAGRTMLVERTVPRSNAFSFVDGAHSWTMHESLFGPPYAALVAWMGPAGFDLIAFVGLTLALALIATAIVGRARRVDAGLTLAFAAIGLFGFRLMSARPTGMSLIFPLALALVAFRPAFSIVAAVAAVAIEIVWANAHGSFPLGLAMLVAAALEGPTDRKRRVVALVLSALGTVINPYGLSLHRFVWSYFRGDEGIFREIRLHILEFGSMADALGTTIGPIDVVSYAGLTVLVLGALTKAAYRVRAAFCLMLLVLGARQARHFEMAGLLACVLLAPYFEDLFERWVPEAPSVPPRPIAAAIVVPAVVAGAVAFGLAFRARAPDQWVAQGKPLLELVRGLPDGARVYVPFQQAGLVLWYDSPRGVRVFYDSRNDCYSAETAKVFLSLERGVLSREEAIAALDRAGTTAVLVPRDHPLSAQLDGAWAASGERGRWRLFASGRRE